MKANFLFNSKKIIIGSLIAAFCLAACENDLNEVRELGRKKPGIEEGKGIDSYLSMNGKMRAHLTAPLLLRYQGDSARKAEFPNTLHVDFYNDSTRIESKLDARYGRYLENENKVFLRDSVVIFNIKGDTLFCNELWWDQNTQKLYTDKRVVLSRDYRKTLIEGLNGMTANQDLSDITFFKIKPNSYSFIPDSTSSAKPAPANPSADTAKKKK